MKIREWVPQIAGKEGPIYLAVADAIAAAVTGGELRPGERLPTHRALADALGVDLTTVTRAYAEAGKRGLLQATVGRGTFVRGADQPKPAPPRQREGGVDLSMNLPPPLAQPAVPELLRSGLADLLARADAADLLTYHSGAGTADDRASGAAWLQSTVGDVTVERVLLSPGAQPGIFAVLSVLLGRGDTVLTDMHTYPGLRSAALQLGVHLVGVEGDGEGLLPEAVEAACEREGAPKALYCIPTIHNPTTATMGLARRQAIAEVARRRGLFVIEDDAYGLLPSRALPAISSLAPECTFHIATVSKILSPALRMAFIVAPDPRFAGRLMASLRANVLMASPLLARLLTTWLQNGTAGTILAATRRECAARQRLARDTLPPGSFAAHPEGLHLWLRLPDYWDRLGFMAQLRRQGGLAVVPSDAFAVAGTEKAAGSGVEAVRLSLGAAPDRDSLRLALRSVAATLQDDAALRFAEVV